MTASPAPTARAAADLRLLRAAVFTAVCVVLSAAGHMAASLTAVPLWTLGVAAAAVFAVAAPLAGRERSLPGIAAGLAVGQVALHALFAMSRQPASAVAETGGKGVAGLSDHAAISMARHAVCGLGSGRLDGDEARRILGSGGFDTALAAGSAGHAGQRMPTGIAADPAMAHCLLPSLPMLLGHLLAALALGWLLRRGEAALWRLVRLSAPAAREVAAQALIGALRGALTLVGALIAGLDTAHDSGMRAPVSYGDDKPGPQHLTLHHSVVRRGPPTLALAA
ncbi:hypothetical protein [Streptomyces sp. NPDC017993]|uniref:hypothetical protein n=1 Tax=Streptomyces sp. NPDC017993 TaxID=3365027 RepID=UPI0037B7AE4B